MKCRHIPTDTDIVNKEFSARYIIDRKDRVCRKCGKTIELRHPILARIIPLILIFIEQCLIFEVNEAFWNISVYYGLTEKDVRYTSFDPVRLQYLQDGAIVGAWISAPICLFLVIAIPVAFFLHYGRFLSWKEV